jgi:hypothetical protein
VKQFRQSITQALIAGVLFILPVYLAILLLLKAAKSLGGVVKPLTRLVPEWFPAENLLSFLLVLVVLPPGWDGPSNLFGPIRANQNRELAAPENPRVRGVSEYDAPNCGRQPGERLATGLG